MDALELLERLPAESDASHVAADPTTSIITDLIGTLARAGQ